MARMVSGKVPGWVVGRDAVPGVSMLDALINQSSFSPLAMVWGFEAWPRAGTSGLSDEPLASGGVKQIEVLVFEAQVHPAARLKPLGHRQARHQEQLAVAHPHPGF